MSSAIKIAPSILAADLLHLEEQVTLALQGGAEYIHLDVMDGQFVRNITFGPHLVEALAPLVHQAGAQIDVHLMIESPEHFIPAFAKAGADIITIHVESCKDLQSTLKGIRLHGARSGLTLRPKTPLISITGGMPYADLILVMSVEPGLGGQTFLPESLARIRRIRELLDENTVKTEIEVDGGISIENAHQIAEAGANVLVAGSAVFRSHQPIPDSVRALRRAADGLLPSPP
jgi:ribulose-phosphate 3-epimerase